MLNKFETFSKKPQKTLFFAEHRFCFENLVPSESIAIQSSPEYGKEYLDVDKSKEVLNKFKSNGVSLKDFLENIDIADSEGKDSSQVDKNRQLIESLWNQLKTDLPDSEQYRVINTLKNKKSVLINLFEKADLRVKNSQKLSEFKDSLQNKDWKSFVPGIRKTLIDLPEIKDNEYIKNPDLWLENLNEGRMRVIYEKLFGKSGLIRREDASGNPKDIFGSEIDYAKPGWQQVVADRLSAVRSITFATRDPNNPSEFINSGDGGHKVLDLAYGEHLENQSTARESLPFRILNGNFNELMDSYEQADAKEKTKILAASGAIIAALWIGYKTLLGDKSKKTAKIVGGLGVVAFAANYLSGKMSDDSRTILEKTMLTGENPDELTQTVLANMDITGDQEKARAMMEFNSISVEDLYLAYSEASLAGNKKEIDVRRLTRVDSSIAKYINPKIAYEVCQEYFTHQGMRYYQTLDGYGIEKMIAKKELKLPNGDLVQRSPQNRSEEIAIGLKFFMDRHTSDGKSHSFMEANWVDYYRSEPKDYFNGVIAETVESIKSGVNTTIDFWKESENRKEVADFFEEKGVELKVLVWDERLKRVVDSELTVMNSKGLSFEEDQFAWSGVKKYVVYRGNGVWTWGKIKTNEVTKKVFDLKDDETLSDRFDVWLENLDSKILSLCNSTGKKIAKIEADVDSSGGVIGYTGKIAGEIYRDSSLEKVVQKIEQYYDEFESAN